MITGLRFSSAVIIMLAQVLGAPNHRENDNERNNFEEYQYSIIFSTGFAIFLVIGFTLYKFYKLKQSSIVTEARKLQQQVEKNILADKALKLAKKTNIITPVEDQSIINKNVLIENIAEIRKIEDTRKSVNTDFSVEFTKNALIRVIPKNKKAVEYVEIADFEEILEDLDIDKLLDQFNEILNVIDVVNLLDQKEFEKVLENNNLDEFLLKFDTEKF